MQKKQSFFRIDEQVYFTMAGICVVSLMVLAFRYSFRPDCATVNIVLPDSLVAGNIIRLKAEMQGGSEFSWNFGDGITRDEKINTTTYNYKAPGPYTIRVIVNGRCEGIQRIYVKDAPVVINTNLLPIIAASDTLYMGVAAKFTDIASTSTSWEWYFGETNSVDDASQEATYTYKTPGLKRVLLRVNGRPDLTREKLVYVIDREAEKMKNSSKSKPVSKPIVVTPVIKENPVSDKSLLEQIEDNKPPQQVEPPKTKAPDVSTKQLAAMITSIAEGESGAEVFNPYLCDNKNVKVAYNGTVVSFTKFCQALSELKKKKIKKISVWRNVNAQTNCIESMVVNIELKKGFWPFN